jgi:hypothetical protein
MAGGSPSFDVLNSLCPCAQKSTRAVTAFAAGDLPESLSRSKESNLGFVVQLFNFLTQHIPSEPCAS